MNDCSARGVAGSNEILGSPSIPFSTKSASFLQIGGHTQVPHPLKVIAGVRKGPPLPQPLGVLANRPPWHRPIFRLLPLHLSQQVPS